MCLSVSPIKEVRCMWAQRKLKFLQTISQMKPNTAVTKSDGIEKHDLKIKKIYWMNLIIL